MALLPKSIRFGLFDTMSLKTMRYVHAVPRDNAQGLAADIYKQITEDFFVNGSLTSRSQVPELFAAIWCGGRETVLVSDHLDRTTKEAMLAALSSINDCPYCGDMLVALVHAGNQHDDAEYPLTQEEERVRDPLLRKRLLWVKAMTTPGAKLPNDLPFTEEELPEAIGAIMAMSDINRYSHIVMDGSPVNAPMGVNKIKSIALRMFGGELRATHRTPLRPGRALELLPPAQLPDDMQWAKANPRIADAIARWGKVVEQEADKVISSAVRERVKQNLAQWNGEHMPISRGWVEKEVGDLAGQERAIARLALLLAKASYQIDNDIVHEILDAGDEQRFVRILSWCSYTASRYLANRIANSIKLASDSLEKAA